MARFTVALTFALMAGVGAVELCANAGAFQADAVASTSCYLSASGAGEKAVCADVDPRCYGSTDFCSCIFADETSCQAAIPGATFYASSCAATQSSLQTWYGDTDAAWCSTDDGSQYLSRTYAEVCCSDGVSVCDPYTIDICLNADFEPDKVYYSYCLSSAFATTELCSSECTAAGGGSYFSDSGRCYCFSIDSAQCLALDPGGYHVEHTCYDQVVHNTFEFTAEEMCASDAYYSAASSCCTSGEDICTSFLDGLCKNDDFLPTAGATSCVQFYATEAELTAASCPSSCTAGYAGGATSSDATTLDYQKSVGYCKSDLDEVPGSWAAFNGILTLDECWDSCVADFGADVVHNVEYECIAPDPDAPPMSFSYSYAPQNDCWCYCQSSCSCMENVGASSTAFKKSGWDGLVPAGCVSDDDWTPGVFADYGLTNDPFYFCECENTGVTTGAECEATLGAGADFEFNSCETHAVSGYSMNHEGAEYIDSVLSQCASGNYSHAVQVTAWAEICCESGVPNGCDGTCYSGASKITVLRGGSDAPVSMRLSEAKVGDRVLASSATHTKPAYATITALPHSKSTGSFVRITMEAHKTDQATANVHEAVVTPHHTFPACSTTRGGGGAVAAKNVKVGDCLHTADGKRTVAHVATREAMAWDQTFSVVLEGEFDRLSVGGILTHANPPVHGAAKLGGGKDHAMRARRDKAKQQLKLGDGGGSGGGGGARARHGKPTTMTPMATASDREVDLHKAANLKAFIDKAAAAAAQMHHVGVMAITGLRRAHAAAEAK